MPFTAWKHTERNRHKDRKKYLVKLSDYLKDLALCKHIPILGPTVEEFS